MITEYELYSDESVHRPKGSDFLAVGGVICTDKGRNRLLSRLKSVRAHYRLTEEVGWKNLSKHSLCAYKEWLDVFFNDPYARHTILYANCSLREWQDLRKSLRRSAENKDEPLASFYYQFLLVSFGGLHDTKRWSIFHDKGYFSKEKTFDKVEFLFNRTYKTAFGPKSSRIIRLARACDSKKSDLIQLADLLLRCDTCCRYEYAPISATKTELLEHFRGQSRMIARTKKGSRSYLFEHGYRRSYSSIRPNSGRTS